MLRRKRIREPSVDEKSQIEPDLVPSTSNFEDGAVSKKDILGQSDDIKCLEKFVLGGEEDFMKGLEKWKYSDNEDSSDAEQPDEETIHKIDVAAVKIEKKPVWVDDDDDSEIQIKKSRKLFRITNVEDGQTMKSNQYVNKLKQHFEKSIGIPAPKWADMKKIKKRRTSSDDSGSDDDNDDLTKRTGNYIGTSINLPRDTLHFKRVCNLTEYHNVKNVINTTEFHRQAQVLLVSGYAQRLMLFQIDGKENPLLETVKFDRFPIETAHFSTDGDRIIVGSTMYSHFFYYDMLSDKAVKVPRIRCLEQQKLGRFCVSPDGQLLAFGGPFGKIHLLSAKTYDFICTLKMNGSVGAFSFSSLGDSLYSHGDDGEVYVWDVRRRECVHKFYDDGCIKGTSIAVSSNDSFLACGSDAGVVNVYDLTSAINDVRPKPLKSLMNLTTPSTRLGFNSSNEILASCSSFKQNSARLFHIPSRTTFQNFPPERENLKNINCFDFSINGGYFCMGNDKGQALLYRLFHYENY